MKPIVSFLFFFPKTCCAVLCIAEDSLNHPMTLHNLAVSLPKIFPLIIDGELSKPIEYNSGVKQGCKLSPTLFGIYAAALLLLAFRNTNNVYSIKVASGVMVISLIFVD